MAALGLKYVVRWNITNTRRKASSATIAYVSQQSDLESPNSRSGSATRSFNIARTRSSATLVTVQGLRFLHTSSTRQMVQFSNKMFATQPACLYTPPITGKTKLEEFTKIIENKYGQKFDTYFDLHKWSVEHYAEFWEEVWKFSNIIHSKPYTQVVDKTKSMDEIPRWFSGCMLNYAENILRYRDDRVAIYISGEHGNFSTVTFKQLFENVREYAAVLRKVGVQAGDRVVGYINNGPEAVYAFLAACSIGAVWSSTAPDFGVSGVLDRFSQIKPKVIFSVTSVQYNGKIHDHLQKLNQVVEALPDLEHVVVIPRGEEWTDKAARPDITHIRNSIFLDEFLAKGREADGSLAPLTFEQLPFSHPLYILYSSGTTGAPKCMVHSIGGTLMQHFKEQYLHLNMSRDDTAIWYTTTGWMMWNYLVSLLECGSAIVLYDGSPFLPTKTVLWDLVDKAEISIFGTSPKYLSVLESSGIKPGQSHRLSRLRAVLSTGAPLKPTSFEFVYNFIKKDVHLGSITGGTDIVSCFAISVPTLPVHSGEIQAPGLGMAVESWSGEAGKAVLGECGELVCTKPFPSMPTHFYNDPDGAKYRKAYFSVYEGVWHHGDYCFFNPKTNGLVLTGRSDGTLNPAGVRFGSSDIYNIVETFSEIEDSVCVAQRNLHAEERVLLFLKMAGDHEFGDDIVSKIKQTIRQKLSPRHVPAVIMPTPEIPYTVNGKKVEVAVRQVIAGEDVKNKGALANPGSLDYYANIEELKSY